MEQLDALLDDLRLQVRAADFDALADLAPRLEAALAGMGQVGDANALQRLRAKAELTADLLEAARRGLRAARRRIEETRRAAQGLHIYDGTGRCSDITPGGPTAGRF